MVDAAALLPRLSKAGRGLRSHQRNIARLVHRPSSLLLACRDETCELFIVLLLYEDGVHGLGLS
jgi:hypothetical protein